MAYSLETLNLSDAVAVKLAYPRDMTSGMINAVSAEVSETFHLMEFNFSGGTLRITTMVNNVTWGGGTVSMWDGNSATLMWNVDSSTLMWNNTIWSGMGGLFSFETIQENSDISASTLNMTLSGVNTSIIAIILQNYYIGRGVSVWLAHFDSNKAIISDPHLIFNGRLNGGFEIRETMSSQDKVGTVTIVANVSSNLSSMEKVSGIQTNSGKFQATVDDVNDKFFSWVTEKLDRRVIWGSQETSGLDG